MAESAKSRAWADPGVDEIRALHRRSSDIGWRDALQELPDSADFFVERMENLELGNWQVLLGPPESPTILDVGCGFGSLTLGSSTFASTAVGVDALPERVAFAGLRARQSQMANTAFVQGDGLLLPFPSDTFDIVTLNGVLEWAGLYADGDPLDLQQRILEEASRVTTRDGCVCVAIENSLAAETLLGLRDTHTDTHILTALPEPLSSVLLRLRLGEDPRVRLHNRDGYERLFGSAGFGTVRSFNLVPSYNNYRFVVRTDDPVSHRFVYDHFDAGDFYKPAARLRKILAPRVPGLLPELAYSFLIVGRQARSPTLLDTDSPVWEEFAQPDDLSGFAVQMRQPGATGIVFHRDQEAKSLLKCWAHGTEEPPLPEPVKHGLEPHLEELRRGRFGPLAVAYYKFLE